MDRKRLRGLIWSAELVIFLALCSQVVIPLPLVPLTGQTFAVGLLASLVDYRIANWTLIGYILLGLIGIPVFASGTSGVGILFGPTGGFIFAFFVQAWIVIGLRRKNTVPYLIVGKLIGALVQLVLGTIWLKFFNQMAWPAAFIAGTIPFLIPAVIKAILASVVARAVLVKIKIPLNMGQRSE